MSPWIKNVLWGTGVAVCAVIIVVATTTSTAKPAATGPRNLILISIDTMRADCLGCYGYPRATSPRIDRMAAEGVLFEDASATSPWTKPSHASMFTGLYPNRHGAIGADRLLEDDHVRLSSLLSERGFQTASVMNCFWMTRHGLDKGFEDQNWVKDPQDRRNQSEVTETAIRWFDQRDREKPFFIFLHYYDAHGDYVSQPRYERMFAGPYEGPADGSTGQLCKHEWGMMTLNEQDMGHIQDLYVAQVRQLDDQLGILFDYLSKENLLDESLVVITSDHGEEFLDHGGVLHGTQQYQEVLRVPLIFRGPGIPQGVRLKTPVSLIDLMPTCLELLGVPVPNSLDGLAVQTLWQDPASSLGPRLLYSEADTVFPKPFDSRIDFAVGPNRIVRNDRFKLHYNIDTEEFRLFDLVEDPGERLDVKDDHAWVTALLLNHMKRFLANPALDSPPAPFSEEELDILRTLGYVGGK